MLRRDEVTTLNDDLTTPRIESGPSDPLPSLPADADRRADALEALLDLAYGASSYLRRHAKPGVRIAAALLIAGSLAACSGSPGGQYSSAAATQPLQQEVSRGLPSAPGQYPIVDGTLGRDAQGVYYFAWRRPTDPTTVRNLASASRVQLGQASTDYLNVPVAGDPILYVRSDTAIPFVASNELATRGGYYGSGYSYWRPFYGGGYRGVGYYVPATRTVSGSTADGSTMSSSAPSFSARTVGLSRAVSGRSGGTGSGTAATTKSGASFSTSSSHGGAAAAKASAFSAGSHRSSFGGSS